MGELIPLSTKGLHSNYRSPCLCLDLQECPHLLCLPDLPPGLHCLVAKTAHHLLPGYSSVLRQEMTGAHMHGRYEPILTASASGLADLAKQAIQQYERQQIMQATARQGPVSVRAADGLKHISTAGLLSTSITSPLTDSTNTSSSTSSDSDNHDSPCQQSAHTTVMHKQERGVQDVGSGRNAASPDADNIDMSVVVAAPSA